MARRIAGDGQPGEWLHEDLPMTGVQLTDVLSGPPTVTGTIDPVYRRLKADDGSPVLDEWATVIYAEADRQIRGAGIYQGGTFNGPQWSLTSAGFASYPHGMGYEAEASFVQADPLDIVRHVWDHLQGGLDSNLGLTVDDSTTTPVRVGTEDISDSTSDGPFQLNPWSTDDLGTVIDDLAKSTPFDYHERHYWNQARSDIVHELQFGYPSIGRRRPELRFVFGENIHAVPTAARDGSKYASHVRFLGAGEGRDMVRAEARMRSGRLRRMVTIDDKSVTGPNRAQRFARRELTARQLLPTVGDVICYDRPQARLGSWSVGDEIRVQGELDWMPIDLWMRVVSITVTPDNPEIIRMSLMRSDLT